MATIGQQIYEPEGTPDDFQRELELEQAYRAHLRREGRDGHPDGCFHCGSHNHPSTDCRDR